MQDLEQRHDGLRGEESRPGQKVTRVSLTRDSTPSTTPQPARPISLSGTGADTHCKAERKARRYQMSGGVGLKNVLQLEAEL